VSIELEKRKVLEIVESSREIDELVEWKIPYVRILRHLRSLIEDGLIEHVDGELRLTQIGRDALSHPPAQGALVTRKPDPLLAARAPQADEADVHLPRAEVE
jgi:hypothetical protein